MQREPWEENEEISEEEDLVVTEHRDQQEPMVTPEEESAMQTTETDPSRVLEEFGEDVSSSPAERGQAPGPDNTDVPED